MTDQPSGPSGERFADDARRYRLDGRIATGGMGEVWRATDTALGREVAVKLLKSEYADDPTFRSRFETEARHAASLHHPGVASVYDVGEAASSDGSGVPRPFLVMELVDGQPLSALLRGGRPLDPAVVRDLLAQAADAIGAAHRAGIVHRDLKPANLMVTPDRKIKITDFGIARATDGLGLTGTGQVMGTPQYLSPEQARGNTATPASDVYSLGVVGFECLSGHRPFEAGSPVATALSHLNDPVPALPASVPADLAAVLTRALVKDPAQRFRDGDAFAAALRDPSASATTQVVAPAAALPPAGPPATHTQVLQPVPPTPPAMPPVAPRETPPLEGGSPWPLVVLMVAILVVAVVIVALLVNHSRSGDDTPLDDQSTSSAPTQTAATPSASPSDTSPTPFAIEEGDYVGRNVDAVAAELRAKGLHVDTTVKTNPGGEDEDTVVSVSPTTGLLADAKVTVVYWGPEPASSSPPTASDTPSPSPSSTPSHTPTPTPSDTPNPTPSGTPTASETGTVQESSSPSTSTSPSSGGA